MLYAIDVDEKKVRNLLFGEHNSSAAEEICKLIIERELIKVVYRKHWSEGLK
jgi:BarA-like signal transduction histidine kinase